MSNYLCCMCIEEKVEVDTNKINEAITLMNGNSLCMIHSNYYLKQLEELNKQKQELQNSLDNMLKR